jgi:hypothetical protein
MLQCYEVNYKLGGYSTIRFLNGKAASLQLPYKVVNFVPSAKVLVERALHLTSQELGASCDVKDHSRLEKMFSIVLT